MSWLYSIVLAGLMFSSNGTSLERGSVPAVVQPVLTEKQVKQDESERSDQTYPFSANGRVAVSNVNGSIVVESWERNEIRLQSVKTADSKETLADVQIKVDARQDSFRVETDYGSWQRQSGGS